MTAAASSKRGRILVVDDEPNVLFTIGTILEDRGYDVVTTESGRRAIEMIPKGAFDLVLTDLSLKDTDGLEVLAAVRENSTDQIAIMLTGYASLDSAIEAIRRGAYDYLTKPTNVEELCQTIERGLEKLRLTRQLRQRVEALTTLNRLANFGVDAVLRSATDVGEALDRIVAIVGELFAPAACAIFLGGGGDGLAVRARHAGAKDAADLLETEAVRALAAEVVRRAEPVRRGDDAFGVPVVWQGKMLGALVVCKPHSAAFTEEQVQTASTIAGRAALAIANADLYREVVKERETLRVILNAAGDGIIGLDEEGRATFFSRSAERVLQYREADVKGQPLERFAAAHPTTESLAAVRQRAAGAPGGVTAGEILFRAANGDDVFCDVMCCDVRRGEVRAVVSIRDARERRSIEEQKTSVLSHLTHELKTPLTSMLAYNYLLMAGKLGPVDERQVEALRVVRRNGQALLALIQNMLATAQISQGNAHYKLQEVSLASVLANVRETFEPVAIERRIEFAIDLAGDLDVTADPEMLGMAINNLVSNALRFTDPGGEVRVVVQEQGAAEAQIEVRDTGIGIPEEFQGRIFQRYFQATASRGGTGLGLEIAKTIVEAHGGRIWLESRVGVGTRFFMTVRKAKAAEGAETQALAK